jgi:SSS family solute:Na+ symporter
MLVIAIISWYQLKGANDKKGISISQETFKTDPIYNIGAFGIMILLAVIYAAFWS